MAVGNVRRITISLVRGSPSPGLRPLSPSGKEAGGEGRLVWTFIPMGASQAHGVVLRSSLQLRFNVRRFADCHDVQVTRRISTIQQKA